MELSDNFNPSIPDRQICFPTSANTLKPYVGQLHNTLDEGVKFYKAYAAACGFQCRMSTIIYAADGTIRLRYVLCNREGVWDKVDGTLNEHGNPLKKKRKTTSSRCDCMARAIFEVVDGGRYKIRRFNEGHTHSMVPAHTRHLMTGNRKVGELEQLFIISGVKANIGAMRTFRLYRELIGSYEAVGCTSDDFKNYVRDLKGHSLDSDAKMLLDALTNKQELGDGFKFICDVDEEKKMRRLIWTDETAVKNYKIYGEAVSFDATYHTNKYQMIFTPFTGRDNHGKCISFGAALISREDTESYSWVLDKFYEIMGCAPRVLITDQDPALRKAVASTWKETRHRFCMWHITIKVAEKLPSRLAKDPDFKANFGRIVWAEDKDPEVFEEDWNNMIDEYDLGGNKWFSDMYEDRAFWIPAYFKDIPMSGLFRTTSFSESENSFFKRFLNKNADLVLLYTNYCMALDSQRNNFKKITYADKTRSPSMLYALPIEKHASQVYTNSIFKCVQDEIGFSIRGCSIRKMYSEDDDNVFVIEDNLDGVFTVRHVTEHDDVSCSCNMFIRKGLVCKHMFHVFTNMRIHKIPEKYIVRRWCKFSIIFPEEAQSEQSKDYVQPSAKGDFRFFKVVADSLGYVRCNNELSE
ncbi:protein FAR1-RELATED SEQUENCE 5-like [Salvia miltiorrhiza]|uniref:protein FAR1-RELATED SEQUENCE 5-like n=1 Tax=Salvia miltiorrhiza TaxID=226208 RepID=UPI0025AD8A9F|nr:protein FAR1-RELATED SEQUENCE 5-like [Salvia miltiorrhiza]